MSVTGKKTDGTESFESIENCVYSSECCTDLFLINKYSKVETFASQVQSFTIPLFFWLFANVYNRKIIFRT